jgi:hypothetical protein
MSALKALVDRTAPTLAEDAVCCLALVVMLYSALHFAQPI